MSDEQEQDTLTTITALLGRVYPGEDVSMVEACLVIAEVVEIDGSRKVMWSRTGGTAWAQIGMAQTVAADLLDIMRGDRE